MAGKKGMKGYPKEVIEKVKELSREGNTQAEIAEKLGYEKMQIRRLLERERIKIRKQEAGIIINPKGRCRSRNLTKEQKLELENKQLQRENDLLKSFLRAAGRM